MHRPFLRPVPDSAPRPARAGLVQPVAAVLTDCLDDVAVAEAAAGLALAHRVPLLLITVLPPQARRSGPGSPAVRAVTARVMPRVGPHGTGCITEVLHLPAGATSRLAAAKGLLALASRHHAPHVVTARRGPRGLDAFTLIEAAALRGGPFVHAVGPTAWTPLCTPPPPHAVRHGEERFRDE
ncbi:hypothetical protein [Streptomyces griseus]|uniref:hypothetical protein n=1 Tax=Streptomyces griseus TaxID=1911 RepID=UPI000ACF9319|nr:hypothetical protein [Streptomyces griseus]